MMEVLKIIFLTLCFIFLIFGSAIFLIDATDEFAFIQYLLRIRERKAKSFLKSPYKFYKNFKPAKELNKSSFVNSIQEAIYCLDAYASNKKYFLSYENFINYVSNITKCVNIYVSVSNVDEITKAKAISESYKCLLQELLTADFLKAGFKDHNKDVVIFLNSLKPSTYFPITKKDYKIFYSKGSELVNGVDFLRKERTNTEAVAVYWILKIEKNLCGKDSRLLITKMDDLERIINETEKEFEYDL